MVESTIQYTRKLNTVEHLFETNEKLAKAIVHHGMSFYNISQAELDQFIVESEKQGVSPDKTSVSQSLKHFVRDWSSEGVREREQAFPCILRTMVNISTSMSSQTATIQSPLRVLLPGAGLGRLAHEIASLGGLFLPQVG